jgi:hypothetical protein
MKEKLTPKPVGALPMGLKLLQESEDPDAPQPVKSENVPETPP